MSLEKTNPFPEQGERKAERWSGRKPPTPDHPDFGKGVGTAAHFRPPGSVMALPIDSHCQRTRSTNRDFPKMGSQILLFKSFFSEQGFFLV
jgi:hypothetical protein